MTPYEIMLSESQERMLMILRPGSEAEARRIFEKWELDFAVIGRVTETGRLVLRMHGEIAADIPVGPLVTEAPLYRPAVARRPDPEPEIDPASLPERDPLECLAAAARLARPSPRSAGSGSSTTISCMGNTVKRPGGDAAVVRVSPENGKALALATDCTPRYCRADPVRGGAQAVAESWRNLTAVGARAAGDHRQHEFRQSGAARDHGPVRRRDRGNARGLSRSRLPGRLGQCVALQRDERQRDPADPGDRRRRADRRCQPRGRSRAETRRATR